MVAGKWYAFPPTSRLFTMVGASGMKGEDLRTFWQSYLGSCAQKSTSADPHTVAAIISNVPSISTSLNRVIHYHPAFCGKQIRERGMLER